VWDQQIGNKRHDRHGKELEELIVGEGPPAMRRRHQLGNIGVDGDQLDPDTDAGDEAPQIDAEGGYSASSHGVVLAEPD
jgi:hypothetical protein